MDRYTSQSDSVTSPARRFTLIPLDDAAEVSPVPKAVRFNNAGTVVFQAVDDVADQTIDVVAGEILEVRIQYLRATGTTVGLVVHGFN